MNRLVDEYQMVIDTTFWKAYLDEIARLRGTQSKMLESADLEKITRLQGGISAIDLVLGLPDKIVVRSSQEKSSIS